MLNPAQVCRMLVSLLWIGSGIFQNTAAQAVDAHAFDEAASRSSQQSWDNDFVKRAGRQLSHRGQNFYFAGANQYYLFYKSREMVDEVLEDAARMGLNTIRTWAFCDGEWHNGYSLQPNAREYHEESFRKLDYAVYKAKQLGIKMVLTLVNNWEAFGGMNAYVGWSSTARNHDDFYSNHETKAIYRDYLKYILYRTNYYTKVRYKDEPAILMWELANEPRIDGGRAHELYNWIDEMAGYIKSIDGNHLVSTGSEGDSASNFYQTHQSPHIDIASFHLYPEDWNLDENGSVEYIRRHANAANHSLNKPVYSGELGLRNKSMRNSVYQRWYKTFAEESVDGALVWLLSGHQEDGSLYPDYDGFTVYYPESTGTVAVIEAFARRTRALSSLDLEPMPAEL